VIGASRLVIESPSCIFRFSDVATKERFVYDEFGKKDALVPE
jgi:hypothetical protein